MKNRDSYSKILLTAVVILVAAMLWSTNSQVPSGLTMSNAYGGVGVANDESETLFTASPDGKTIYMWQYFSSKPPKFVGQAEAVLSVPAAKKK